MMRGEKIMDGFHKNFYAFFVIVINILDAHFFSLKNLSDHKTLAFLAPPLRALRYKQQRDEVTQGTQRGAKKGEYKYACRYSRVLIFLRFKIKS